MEQPNGKLQAINSQEPYAKDYAYIIGIGKRRIYTDESKQRWVKCSGRWYKFPEEIEL